MTTIIKQYNAAWRADVAVPPLCILIGGAAGTGKSTLLDSLSHVFSQGTIISTGTIRAILRTVISSADNPYLYEQTFTADQALGTLGLIDAYRTQCGPVLASVDKLIEFTSQEKQHHFIEGSHLYPRVYKNDSCVIIIDIYLHIKDSTKYREMVSGPTHQRILTEKQFKNCLDIQNFIVSEAKRLQKPLFDITEPGSELEICKHISAHIAAVMPQTA